MHGAAVAVGRGADPRAIAGEYVAQIGQPHNGALLSISFAALIRPHLLGTSLDRPYVT
jgi:hypothetical protein